MNSRRPSFEEWLKNQGVVEKRENTQKIGGLQQSAGINYTFENEEKAKAFCDTYHMTADQSRHPFKQDPTNPYDQVIIEDPISKRKTAVYVAQHKHTELVAAYKRYLQTLDLPRSSAEIKAHLAHVEQRMTVLANKELGERLTPFQALAANRTEAGWNSQSATSAFDLSLRNYIALNMDLFSKEELQSLQTAANLIMGPNGSVHTGIKQDANWWNDTIQQSEANIQVSVITDALHLLDGEKFRRSVDNKTKPGLPMVLTDDEKKLMLKEDKKSVIKSREIKQFFPGKDGKSSVDAIYLDTGGSSTHRTITKIWKQGVDIHGVPVKPGQPIHHYNFYQTEYNAGARSTWETGPVFNPETQQNKTGVIWVVSTKRILPTWQFNSPLQPKHDLQGSACDPNDKDLDPAQNLDEYNRVMRDTIANRIIAHRMVKLYKANKQSNVAGDKQSLAAIGEGKKWQTWNDKINLPSEKQIDELSFLGAPQTSGNCSVMSVKVMMDHEIHSLSEEHWRHAKQYDYEGTQKIFAAKKKALEKELAAAKEREKASLINLIEEGNVNKIKEIIDANPEFIIGQDKQNKPLPLLIPALWFLKTNNSKPDNEKKEIERQAIIDYLLTKDSKQLNLLTAEGTVLHYAVSHARDDNRFIPLIVKMINRGADLNVVNAKNESPLKLMLDLPLDVLKTLCFELMRSPGKEQFDVAVFIIQRKPELLNMTFTQHNAVTTPLHLALEANNINAVQALLKLNADVTKKDSRYNSPLFLALEQIQKWLEDKEKKGISADDIKKIDQKITAFVPIVQALIEKNPSMLDAPNKSTLTPLTFLADKKNKNIKAFKSIWGMKEVKNKLAELKIKQDKMAAAIQTAEAKKKAPAKEDYEILIGTETLKAIQAYHAELKKHPELAGARLTAILEHKNLKLNDLTTEAFLECLIQTKQPQIYAESQVKGDGSDWNVKELKILGDVNFAVPVTIFDNGVWRGPGIIPHSLPFKGHLLFTPGALLGGVACDSDVTNDDHTINQDKYNELCERRLLPLLIYANHAAGAKGAFITVPGIGCGQFAGEFKGKLGPHFQQALEYILEKHGKSLPNVRALYFTPVDEDNENNKNKPTIIHNIDLRVRPQNINNGEHQLDSKPQLCHPVEYNEKPEDHFDDCEFFSFVAWDHVSWPGNDYYIGSRHTDDGAKSAATNAMSKMTGEEGKYNPAHKQYISEKGRWLNSARDKELEVKGRVFVTDDKGNKKPLPEMEKKLDELKANHSSTKDIFSTLNIKKTKEEEIEDKLQALLTALTEINVQLKITLVTFTTAEENLKSIANQQNVQPPVATF